MSSLQVVEDVWLSACSDPSVEMSDDLSMINPQPMSPVSNDRCSASAADQPLTSGADLTADVDTGCKSEPSDHVTSSRDFTDSGFMSDRNNSSDDHVQVVNNPAPIFTNTFPQPIVPINIFVSPPNPSPLNSFNSYYAGVGSSHYGTAATVNPAHSLHVQQPVAASPYALDQSNASLPPQSLLLQQISREVGDLYDHIRQRSLATPLRHAHLNAVEAEYRFHRSALERQHSSLLRSLPATSSSAPGGCPNYYYYVNDLHRQYYARHQSLLASAYSKLSYYAPLPTPIAPLPPCTPRVNPAGAAFRPVATSTPVRRRKVTSAAIVVMCAWYDRNLEHPYPNAETSAELARAGDISQEQVKKWFANKRMRCRNTKHISAIAARRVRGRRCGRGLTTAVKLVSLM